MRLIGNFLFYLLIVLGTGYLLKDNIALFLIDAKTPYIIPEGIDTDITKTYLVDKDNSLNFSLSQAPEKIWLASTARVIEQQIPAWVATYQLKIDFLDRSRQVIYSHLHQTQTDVEIELLIDELKIPKRFFETIDIKATKSRSIYFSKAVYTGAHSIRVSVIELSDNVKDIAISVYQRQLKDRKLSPYVIWDRMSRTEKESKAKLHALPADFIHDNEKFSYAQYRWEPIAPDTVLGVNLNQVNLYTIAKAEGFWPTVLWNNQIENLSDNFKSVTFSVHQEEEITFSLNHAYKDNKPYQATVKWFPPYSALPYVKKYQFSGASSILKQSFGRGLVEITTTIPVDISPIIYNENAFPNEKHFISSYLVNNNQPITFEINNTNKELITVRLDIRQYNILNQPNLQKPFSVKYQWLDTNEHVMKTGRMATNVTPDPYQQIVSDESYDQVSMATSKYFVLPRNVHKIRLLSSEPMLASLSLSFENIHHAKSLPAQVRNWFDFPENIKYWHELKPLHWQKLEHQGLRFPIRLYHKPVFIAPEILAGDFQSNPIPIIGDDFIWRDLMTPFIRHSNIKEASPQFTFSRIKQNTQVIRLVDKDKENSAPSLFFTRNEDEIKKIDLTINRQQIKPNVITQKWGKLNVQEKSESYNIDFSDKSIHWYLNQQKVKTDSYVSRRGTLIEKSIPVTFKVDKKIDNTTLLLRFFSINSRYAELSVTIKAPIFTGVYEEYTPRNQVYKLTSKNKKLGFALQSDHRISEEHKITLNLLSDLPKGEYELEIQLKTQSKGFISLNEISTEPFSTLTTYKGVEADHE
jgi:hypothetical protein